MDFLKNVETRLDLPAAVKQQVLRELASHLAECRAELIESGISEAQAALEAEKRMGEPADVAARLSAAHNSASWKSALLCAVPFVGSALLLAISLSHARLALAAALCVLFSAASIWELAKGRRPVWLAPWLAGAFANIYGLAFGASFVGTPKAFPLDAWGFLGSLLALVTLATAWRVGHWKILVLGLSIPALAAGAYYLCAGSPEHANALPVLAIFICGLLLLVLFARLVFELHPYGSAVQASVFLLVWFALRVDLVASMPSPVGLFIAIELAAGAVVALLARAPSFAQKEHTMWAVIALYSLGNAVLLEAVHYSGSPAGAVLSVAFGTAVYASVASVVILAPIEKQRRATRPNTPSIAR